MAGVSTATVSRALRGLPNVSEATRDRVRSAAAMLGYVPTPSASSLASGRTRTVGVLTPWVSHWFFASVIEGAERALRREGYDALLYTFMVERRGRQAVDVEVLRRRVDGVLVVGLPLATYELQALFALQVPVVFVGSGVEGQVTIRLDDHAIGRQAVELLLELGHTRIGHVTGLPDTVSGWSPPIGRQRGWLDALHRAGITPAESWVVNGYFDVEGGRDSGHRLFSQFPDVTAVFATSDEMAMGVILAAHDVGRRIPEDLSVVGVDGTEFSEVVGLTTFAQDAGQQGADAAEILLRIVAGGPEPSPETTVYPAELVVRSSTGPAPE